MTHGMKSDTLPPPAKPRTRERKYTPEQLLQHRRNRYQIVKASKPEQYARMLAYAHKYRLDNLELVKEKARKKYHENADNRREQRRKIHAEEYARFLELRKRPVPLRFMPVADQIVYKRVLNRLSYYKRKLTPEQFANFDPYNPASL